MKAILGQHHVSAMTGDAKKNLRFYTEVLGMRLVKKTVNQDDPSMYHLFYADETGAPGTDLTFFELPFLGQTYRGSSSLSRTALRVPAGALPYWLERFAAFGVLHDEVTAVLGRPTLYFEDEEGQRLCLVEGGTGTPWRQGPVSADAAVFGLGFSEWTVRRPEKTERVLTDLLGYRFSTEIERDGQVVRVFETGDGGVGTEIHLVGRPDLPSERPGRGSVHHVAIRVEDDAEMGRWVERLDAFGISHSGLVDRYYFKSIYFREPSGILVELATDGPGFATDEPVETLGERLALPPFLEPRRAEIERKLKPI
ncbi:MULTISPECIES: ring-cleaving dioxygenase [unclassified Exiguobacterium]|uniref:ring-cleaving dioxygenase n=1 Tax=unclassified Exiguobacterium TaxID=2644629 RepID=UPI00103EF061|nr:MULTISPECIES: ring-cleaving dioxygenase [unclassified Exiguobacterium]TCI48475.1 ring-cleaving dioxygenase [Exiguobacterium sp. SH5S32]TCI55362.1 ring-cleaving dioxygenase [Exiguobacterium sp. SH1S4]TCI75156.1 ring-cleaving dioxygenase [Exiguobacterium sp. SH1S1]